MTQLTFEKITMGIEKIVGSENYSIAQHILYSYAEDASPFEGNPPNLVARPHSTSEVSQIVQFAESHKVPIVPVGGRSGISGAAIPRTPSAIMLDLTSMNNII